MISILFRLCGAELDRFFINCGFDLNIGRLLLFICFVSCLFIFCGNCFLIDLQFDIHVFSFNFLSLDFNFGFNFNFEFEFEIDFEFKFKCDFRLLIHFGFDFIDFLDLEKTCVQKDYTKDMFKKKFTTK